jgi:hypothetical protein
MGMQMQTPMGMQMQLPGTTQGPGLLSGGSVGFGSPSLGLGSGSGQSTMMLPVSSSASNSSVINPTFGPPATTTTSSDPNTPQHKPGDVPNTPLTGSSSSQTLDSGSGPRPRQGSVPPLGRREGETPLSVSEVLPGEGNEPVEGGLNPVVDEGGDPVGKDTCESCNIHLVF